MRNIIFVIGVLITLNLSMAWGGVETPPPPGHEAGTSPDSDNAGPKTDERPARPVAPNSPRPTMTFEQMKQATIAELKEELKREPTQEELDEVLGPISLMRLYQEIQKNAAQFEGLTEEQAQTKVIELLKTPISKMQAEEKGALKAFLSLQIAQLKLQEATVPAEKRSQYNKTIRFFRQLHTQAGGTEKDIVDAKPKAEAKLAQEIEENERAQSAQPNPQGSAGPNHGRGVDGKGVTRTNETESAESQRPESPAQTTTPINPTVANQLALVQKYKDKAGQISSDERDGLDSAMKLDTTFNLVDSHLKDRKVKIYGMVMKLRANPQSLDDKDTLNLSARLVTAMSSAERDKFLADLLQRMPAKELGIDPAMAKIGLAAIVEKSMRGETTPPTSAEIAKTVKEKIPAFQGLDDKRLEEIITKMMAVRKAESDRVVDYNSKLESCKNGVAAACESIRNNYGQDVFQYHAGQASLADGDKKSGHLDSFKALSGIKEAGEGTASLWVVRDGKVIHHHVDAKNPKLVEAYANEIATNGGFYDFSRNKNATKLQSYLKEYGTDGAKIKAAIGDDKELLESFGAARIAKLKEDGKIDWIRLDGNSSGETSNPNPPDGGNGSTVGDNAPPNEDTMPQPTSEIEAPPEEDKETKNARVELAQAQIQLVKAQDTVRTETDPEKQKAAQAEVTRLTKEVDRLKSEVPSIPEAQKSEAFRQLESRVATDEERMKSETEGSKKATLRARIAKGKRRLDAYNDAYAMPETSVAEKTAKANVLKALELNEQVAIKEQLLADERSKRPTERLQATIDTLSSEIKDLKEQISGLSASSEMDDLGDDVLKGIIAHWKALEESYKAKTVTYNEKYAESINKGTPADKLPSLKTEIANLKAEILKLKEDIAFNKDLAHTYRRAKRTLDGAPKK